MTRDPLDEIFDKVEEINAEVLASILRGFVKISIDTNTVFFTEKGSSLSVNYRVLLFLIARKTLKFRKKIGVEEVSPTEIIEETGMRSGSVHPSLKLLREKSLVSSKGGKYIVPNFQLSKIRRAFEEKKHG